MAEIDQAAQCVAVPARADAVERNGEREHISRANGIEQI